MSRSNIGREDARNDMLRSHEVNRLQPTSTELFNILFRINIIISLHKTWVRRTAMQKEAFTTEQNSCNEA